MRFCILYTCCSNFLQGSLRQLSLSGSSDGFRLVLGAFVSVILLVPLSSMSPCSRERILGVTPGVGFLSNPPLKCIRVVPCSPYRPFDESGLESYPVPTIRFAFPLGSCYPPRTFRVKDKVPTTLILFASHPNSASLILLPFGQVCQPV